LKMLFDETYKPFSEHVDFLLEKADKKYINAVNDLWSKFSSYASPSFQREILTNNDKYHSLLWEMILTCKFLQHGYKVEKSTDDDRPDIGLIIDDKKVWIECCLPTRGQKGSSDYVEPLQADGIAHQVDKEANLLRCTSALYAKKEQHLKWLQKGICKKDEAFIIALSGYFLDLSIFNNMLPDILGALYAMGNAYMVFDVKNNNETVEEGFEERPILVKKNKTEIPTTFFLDEGNEHITGVIFSEDWIMHHSNTPDYCYVENIFCSDNMMRTNFDSFMQTYASDESGISMK